MKEISPELKRSIGNLPQKPGVYQFYDKEGKLLYVGKAKKLRNRVNSYFSKQKYESGKTRLMVSKISRIEYIVVHHEYEALLLENTLIKKNQPRYNVMLRDDKTYPWLCLKNEPFPKVFATRKVIEDGSEYYGPYPSMKTLRMLLDVITKGYKLRTCSYLLNEKNVEQKKYRLCVEYQIGNCAGPCEGLEREEDYQSKIEEIRKIIKGDTQQLLGALKERMMRFSDNHEFEQAHEIKLRMELIDKYRSKSTVVNSKIHNVDVFSIVSDAYAGYVNFMKINNGAVIQSHTMEIRKRMDESDAEILSVAIVDVRQKFSSQSTQMYLSKDIDIEIPGIAMSVPKIGDKKRLIDLSLKNANYYMLDRYKDLEKVDPDRYKNRILDQVKSDLKLNVQPDHMECFDNSNMQGKDPVAACVVFKNGKPSKKDYRHFNIKTVKGPDDFASMEEVVYRRYSRMLREGEPLPQVVVIDGGKGQLSAAMKSIRRLGIEKELTVLGIAKRLEEIYYPGDQVPIYLDKRSSTLRLIQNMRNEAHRFGITHHRGKRAKRSIRSELSEITGIGPKTTEILLKKFGSVKQVKSASFELLAQAIGASKAVIVREYFNQQDR